MPQSCTERLNGSVRTYSMVNDVKNTVPRWRPPLCAWSGRIGHLYMSMRWILMLSNRSRGTLISYIDHSAQRRFKSNAPNVSQTPLHTVSWKHVVQPGNHSKMLCVSLNVPLVYQNISQPFIFWPPVLLNVLWLLFSLFFICNYSNLRYTWLRWWICKLDVASIFFHFCVVSKSPAEISTPIGAVLELLSHANLPCLVKWPMVV